MLILQLQRQLILMFGDSEFHIFHFLGLFMFNLWLQIKPAFQSSGRCNITVIQMNLEL